MLSVIKLRAGRPCWRLPHEQGRAGRWNSREADGSRRPGRGSAAADTQREAHVKR